MSALTAQRIRYLIETGSLYPDGEPATKNFVVKAMVIIGTLQLVDTVLTVWRLTGR